jgi:hypothetical protein
MNLAGLHGYQRAYFLYLLGTYYTTHKLNVSINYDYNPNLTQQIIVSPTNYNPPYGSQSPYGNQTPYGGPSQLEQWKLHLQRQLCESVQVTITETFDSSFGVPAGAGLTLSGLNFIVGLKKGMRPLGLSNSAG